MGDLVVTDELPPFPHSSTSHEHSTWAKTFHSRPRLFVQPETIHEIQDLCRYAHVTRAHIVVTGASHSPSDLTCTSSWLVSLRNFSKVLDVRKDKETGEARVTVQAGLSLHELSERLVESDGLIIPNLGSIDVQSVAGAIATGTHGSSLYHGILAQNVYSLKICLADGSIVRCSADDKPSLFRAALVSLGALGIVVEVEIRMVPTCNVEWSQDLRRIDEILSTWDKGHWTQAEFVRCWWLPYQRNMTVWTANKTSKPKRAPSPGILQRIFGIDTYEYLLWMAQKRPWLLPLVERFMFGVNNVRLSTGHVSSGVDEQRSALLMDCGFSQLVNEWGIPLHKGPEAIRRLQAWLSQDQEASCIPFDPIGVYVHFPIEVRVTDNSTSKTPVRGFLDPTMQDGPTLYLNATLYRPFGEDPPCFVRYYQAFEWLMKELGGKPHWAKNFQSLSNQDFEKMYGQDLVKWRDARRNVDPSGIFAGPWHRRTVLDKDTPFMKNEEIEVERFPVPGGGFEVRSTRA